MKIRFTKMQSCGNDYIYINSLDRNYKSKEKIAIMLSDRHFSVGSDGVVFIEKSKIANCKMSMYNSDGSQGNICGNALISIAKYLFEKGIVDKTCVTVETLSGVRTVNLKIIDNKVVSCCTCFCFPEFIEMTKIAGLSFNTVNVGNNHAVAFVGDLQKVNYEKVVKAVLKKYDNNVNVEFATVKEGRAYVKVYERGSGLTLSCGSGACAVSYVGVLLGKLQEGENTLVFDGGTLKTVYNINEEVYLQGTSKKVFSGEIEI